MIRITYLASLLLGAGASVATALPRPVDTAEREYVLGRFAYVDDKLPEAARYFDAARKQDPTDLALSRRTFDLAVAAGDQKLAVSLANQLAGTDRGDSTVALVRLAEALQRRDWKTADAVRPGLADAGYAAVVGPIAQGWTLYGRGRVDEALAVLDPAKFQGFARSYIIEHRALMLAAAKRHDAAATEYATLLAGGAANVARVRIAAASALQAAGKPKEAAVLLDAAIGDAQVDAARGRLSAGKPIGGGVTEARQGMAWLAVRLAADLAREKPVPLALVFARVATFLAPELAETWLICGDVLARGGRADAAIAAYARVASGDVLAPLARARRALVLSDAGRDKDARALLEAATTAPTATSDDWARLGDFDRKATKPVDAARAYDRALAVAGNPGTAGWQLYFLRGSAYEQAGDWARAEPDLRQALKLSPQEPIVLNYLGYALLDRGLLLPEAQLLIEAAAKLKPDDGFITDSLGWAYFRTGQFDKAAAALERAVAAEPGDPTINEHLGDAYWRVGRKLESRFRWRAALDLGAPQPQVAAIQAKLDFGLDVALAQAPVAR